MNNPPLPTEANSAADFLDVWKANRRELVSFLEKLDDSKFMTAPAKGGWSASEIAEHLYLTQWNLSRSIPIVLAGKFGMDRSALKTDLRYETLFKLISKPRGAKNPIEVGPRGGMDKKTAFESLKKSEEKLDKAALSRTTEELKSRGMEHPFFGPISIFDWLWVMTNHEYSHIGALIEKYS